MEKYLSLKQLSEEVKVPERTIRYYISRGLLDPPLKRGPKAIYGKKHIEALMKIKELQEKGFTLSEISNFLNVTNHGELSEELNEVQLNKVTSIQKPLSVWRAYEIEEGIIVLVREDIGDSKIKRVINTLKIIIQGGRND